MDKLNKEGIVDVKRVNNGVYILYQIPAKITKIKLDRKRFNLENFKDSRLWDIVRNNMLLEKNPPDTLFCFNPQCYFEYRITDDYIVEQCFVHFSSNNSLSLTGGLADAEDYNSYFSKCVIGMRHVKVIPFILIGNSLKEDVEYLGWKNTLKKISDEFLKNTTFMGFMGWTLLLDDLRDYIERDGHKEYFDERLFNLSSLSNIETLNYLIFLSIDEFVKHKRFDVLVNNARFYKMFIDWCYALIEREEELLYE